MNIAHLEFETVDSNATIAFFSELEKQSPYGQNIDVILDNAGYCKEEVQKQLKKAG